jgi:hypothetical protein
MCRLTMTRTEWKNLQIDAWYIGKNRNYRLNVGCCCTNETPNNYTDFISFNTNFIWASEEFGRCKQPPGYANGF